MRFSQQHISRIQRIQSCRVMSQKMSSVQLGDICMRSLRQPADTKKACGADSGCSWWKWMKMILLTQWTLFFYVLWKIWVAWWTKAVPALHFLSRSPQQESPKSLGLRPGTNTLGLSRQESLYHYQHLGWMSKLVSWQAWMHVDLWFRCLNMFMPL